MCYENQSYCNTVRVCISTSILECMSMYLYMPSEDHTGRVLCIADSPTGEFVASVGADEAICVWNCFERDRRSVSYDYHSIYSAGAATGGIPMTK